MPEDTCRVDVLHRIKPVDFNPVSPRWQEDRVEVHGSQTSACAARARAQQSFHVEGAPIDHRDGMRRCCGVRIAAAVATSTRSEPDETTDDHQHNPFPGRTH
jgi:hypothetical protein